MAMRIAVLTDVHFSSAGPLEAPDRRGEIADVLLLRAVHRLNRFVRPDVTVLLGDLVDRGDTAYAREDLERLRPIVELIDGPVINIPGNHDGDQAVFYSVFERPPDVVDIQGVRFVPFIDPEAPEYNALRLRRDLERMGAARSGFDGPVVALQHVPVFPPGAADCPYNYTNADAVLDAMRRHGYVLSLSGHYHAGFELLRTDGPSYVSAPTLCKPPFRFLVIDLGGRRVATAEHALRMPDELGLVDLHVHTPFAYCNENMDIAKAMALGEDFGLAGLAFSEHTSHLYFDEPTYSKKLHLIHGVKCPTGRKRRMDDYFEATAAAGCAVENVALEVDCDFQGRPVLLPEDRARPSFLIGAMHRLRALKGPNPDVAAAADEFLYLLERFLPSGIDVLAHPFRVFPRAGTETPRRLFAPTVGMLEAHGVAAEINFHTNDPPPEFIRLCLDAGVKLTFASDAHNLYEVGEFAPHLALLQACGYDGELSAVLLDPRRG